MEETEGFESNNLKILVLDEADTMLEMGFRETLNAILEYIPAQR
jgi:ATP-dependent RNA helicase DDX10/DBP4